MCSRERIFSDSNVRKNRINFVLRLAQAEHCQLNLTKVTAHKLMQIELCKANFLEGYLDFFEFFLEIVLIKHLNALWLHILKWL